MEGKGKHQYAYLRSAFQKQKKKGKKATEEENKFKPNRILCEEPWIIKVMLRGSANVSADADTTNQIKAEKTPAHSLFFVCFVLFCTLFFMIKLMK